MRFKAIAVSVLAVFICTQLTAKPKLMKKLEKLTQKKEQKKEVKYDLEMDKITDLEQAVMALLPKNSKLVHPITEGVYGPSDGKMGSNINVIYSTSGKTPEILVLKPVKAGKYNKIKPEVLSFGATSSVNVVSVFYNQIDKDAPRELLVLCYVTGKNGDGYKTAVFDWQTSVFKRVPAIESQLDEYYPAIKVRLALHKALRGK